MWSLTDPDLAEIMRRARRHFQFGDQQALHYSDVEALITEVHELHTLRRRLLAITHQAEDDLALGQLQLAEAREARQLAEAQLAVTRPDLQAVE